jgi:hypothetical protein
MSMVARTLPSGSRASEFRLFVASRDPCRQLQNAVPIGIQYAYKLHGNCRLSSGEDGR